VQIQGKFAGLHWLFARRGNRTPCVQSDRPRIALVMTTFWGVPDVMVTKSIKVDVRVLEREGIAVMGIEELGIVVVGIGMLGKMVPMEEETEVVIAVDEERW
jgi:hypothetical protein